MISGMGDREAGTNGGSRGPTMYAWNPLFADRGGVLSDGTGGSGDTSKIPVTRLLQYMPSTLSPEPGSNCVYQVGTSKVGDYSLTDAWHGGAWLNHASRQAIAFIGYKCNYVSHYYQAANPCGGNPCNENTGWVCGETGDPDPYTTKLWFFDPDDIALTADSTIQVNTPQPFAELDLTQYQWDPTECQASFKDMAYDETAGVLYATENIFDSGGRTIVHVFDVNELPEYLLDIDLVAPTYVVQGDSFQFVLDWDFQDTASCTFAASDSVVTRISVLATTQAGAESEVSFATGPGVNTVPPHIFTYAFPELGSYDDTVMLRGRVMFTAPAACADTVYTDSRGIFVQLPE